MQSFELMKEELEGEGGDKTAIVNLSRLFSLSASHYGIVDVIKGYMFHNLTSSTLRKPTYIVFFVSRRMLPAVEWRAYECVNIGFDGGEWGKGNDGGVVECVIMVCVSLKMKSYRKKQHILIFFILKKIKKNKKRIGKEIGVFVSLQANSKNEMKVFFKKITLWIMRVSDHLLCFVYFYRVLLL